MERDFSQAALDKLLNMIREINDEQWCSFSDELGDWWFGTVLYSQEISDCSDDIDGFHKRMLDKNNLSESQLREIFAKVEQIDQNYATRFSASLVNLQNFQNAIKALTQVLSPNGHVSVAETKRILEDGYYQLEAQRSILRQLATEGLTVEILNQIDEKQLTNTLNSVASVWIDHIPSVKLGTKYEIPIGPGLVFYYKNSTTLKGTGDTTINLILEEQRLKFKNAEYSRDFGGLSISGNTEKEGSVMVSGGGLKGSINVDGSLEFVNETNLGNNTTQSIIGTINLLGGSISIESTIKTTLDGGSIYSTIGIKATSENNWGLDPIPIPAEQHGSVQLPRFEALDVVWDLAGPVIVEGATIIDIALILGELLPVLVIP